MVSSVGCSAVTDFSYQLINADSLVIPRLSVMLPCLIRPGSLCTKLLTPPSGYSCTSSCDEKPLIWVKNPSVRLIAGIVTWKNFEWVIGGLASVAAGTLAVAVGIGGSLRVVDDQVPHLLALG